MVKLRAPKRVIVFVMAFPMASMEVKIPTKAVMPMAIMEAVITARRRCDFKELMPCRICSTMMDKSGNYINLC
jgi:hypothetical protein